MAAKKKAKKPLAKKAMKKTKGGAEIPFYLKLHGVDGDVTHVQGTTVNYTGLE